jgi:hypothetical protein
MLVGRNNQGRFYTMLVGQNGENSLLLLGLWLVVKKGYCLSGDCHFAIFACFHSTPFYHATRASVTFSGKYSYCRLLFFHKEYFFFYGLADMQIAVEYLPKAVGVGHYVVIKVHQVPRYHVAICLVTPANIDLDAFHIAKVLHALVQGYQVIELVQVAKVRVA